MTMVETETARNSHVLHSQVLQRFSFVEKPTDETAQFVLEQYATNQGASYVSSAYALGSLVSRYNQTENQELQSQLNSRMVSDLEAAESIEKQSTLLVALGNAGQMENIPVVESYSSDASWRVRESAAQALIDTQSPQSEEILLKLSTDSDVGVQRTALHILERYELGQASLEELAGLVTQGHIKKRDFDNVLLLVENLQEPSLKRGVLEYLHRNAMDDPALKGRILRTIDTIQG